MRHNTIAFTTQVKVKKNFDKMLLEYNEKKIPQKRKKHNSSFHLHQNASLKRIFIQRCKHQINILMTS